MFNSLSFVQFVVLVCALFAFLANEFGIVAAILSLIAVLLLSVFLLMLITRRHNQLIAEKFSQGNYDPIDVFRVNRRWTGVDLLVLQKDQLTLVNLNKPAKIVTYEQIKEVKTATSNYQVSLNYNFVLVGGEEFNIELDQMNATDDMHKIIFSQNYQTSLALLLGGLTIGSVGSSYAASNEVALGKTLKFENAFKKVMPEFKLIKNDSMRKNETKKSVLLAGVALFEILLIVIVYIILMGE